MACLALFRLRDEKSITMPRLECFWLCAEAKKESFVMPLHQEYTKWGRVWVSVFNLGISVQQRNWCHTRATAKILRENWHLIVTEDISNEWWSPKVYIMIFWAHMMVGLVILEYVIHCNFPLDCRTVLFGNVRCLNG